MSWLVLRQYRKQFLFTLATLVLIAILTLTTGTHLSNAYHQALKTCGQTNSCSQLPDELFQGDGAIYDSVIAIALGAPLLLGLFLGAPLISREYEDGTNKLVWTQSVTRRKWLSTKLGWVLLIAALYGAILTALVSWWSKTPNALYLNRFGPAEFDAQGLMPLVYAIFATSLGIMLGAWFRRVLLALAITLAVFVAMQASVAMFVRPHYMHPITQTGALIDNSRVAPAPGDIWIISQNVVSPSGHPITFVTAPEGCKSLPQNEDISTCLAAIGYHRAITYQPADRYWKFQEIEAAGYIALSAIFVAATYGFVLKRDA